jgi:phosphohistidine phosphatase
MKRLSEKRVGNNTNKKNRRFYLVRHGEAQDKAVDPSQALTPTGRETARRVAAWAVEAGVHIDQIWQSGKKRAEQTAQIFAEFLKPVDGVRAVDGLQPVDEVQPVAQNISRRNNTIMIVGHLPFVSRLTNLLIGAAQDQDTIIFHPARLVGFVLEEAGWRIEMMVPTEVIRQT